MTKNQQRILAANERKIRWALGLTKRGTRVRGVLSPVVPMKTRLRK